MIDPLSTFAVVAVNNCEHTTPIPTRHSCLDGIADCHPGALMITAVWVPIIETKRIVAAFGAVQRQSTAHVTQFHEYVRQGALLRHLHVRITVVYKE